MIIEPLEDAPSPILPGHRRKACQITYELAGAEPEVVWFDVPAEFAWEADTCGNAWLISLVPLAWSLGEKLVIRAPVDPVLFQNADELMRIWSKWHVTASPIESIWYRGASPIEITCPFAALPSTEPPARVASFFTGGIDAFFTILHQASQVPRYQPAGERVVDNLIYAWGFDLPLKKRDELVKLSASLAAAAKSLGKPLWLVATNLRETRFGSLPWGGLTHGCGLGAVAHFLGRSFATIFISSSRHYGNPSFWGSHPLTDPLMSSSNLRIRHYGCGFDRFEKTEFISNNAIARRHLHVCFHAETAANCGNCEKCYRTMLMLETLGRLRETEALPARFLKLNKAVRIITSNETVRSYYAEIVRQAGVRNRRDIVEAVRACQKWNRQRERVQAVAAGLENIPWARRPLAALTRRVYQGAIE